MCPFLLDHYKALLEGIAYIAKVRPETTRLGNFEAIYKTKGNFKIITSKSSGKVEAVVVSVCTKSGQNSRPRGDSMDLKVKTSKYLSVG